MPHLWYRGSLYIIKNCVAAAFRPPPVVDDMSDDEVELPEGATVVGVFKTEVVGVRYYNGQCNLLEVRPIISASFGTICASIDRQLCICRLQRVALQLQALLRRYPMWA